MWGALADFSRPLAFLNSRSKRHWGVRGCSGLRNFALTAGPAEAPQSVPGLTNETRMSRRCVHPGFVALTFVSRGALTPGLFGRETGIHTLAVRNEGGGKPLFLEPHVFNSPPQAPPTRRKEKVRIAIA